MKMRNTLAYYDMIIITPVKSFIIEVPEASVIQLYLAVIHKTIMFITHTVTSIKLIFSSKTDSIAYSVVPTRASFVECFTCIDSSYTHRY